MSGGRQREADAGPVALQGHGEVFGLQAVAVAVVAHDVQRDEVHRDADPPLLQLLDEPVPVDGELLLPDADDEQVPGMVLGRLRERSEEIQPAERVQVAARDRGAPSPGTIPAFRSCTRPMAAARSVRLYL